MPAPYIRRRRNDGRNYWAFDISADPLRKLRMRHGRDVVIKLVCGWGAPDEATVSIPLAVFDTEISPHATFDAGRGRWVFEIFRGDFRFNWHEKFEWHPPADYVARRKGPEK